jgi:hypothetical protein
MSSSVIISQNAIDRLQRFRASCGGKSTRARVAHHQCRPTPLRSLLYTWQLKLECSVCCTSSQRSMLTRWRHCGRHLRLLRGEAPVEPHDALSRAVDVLAVADEEDTPTIDPEGVSSTRSARERKRVSWQQDVLFLRTSCPGQSLSPRRHFESSGSFSC